MTDRFVLRPEARRVREAEPADLGRLAQVLQRAFRDDPVYRWMVPGDRQWERHGRRLFQCYLRQTALRGKVLTTPSLEGASLWIAPSAPGPGGLERLRSAVALLRTVRMGTPRALRAAAVIQRNHMQAPHWYLSILGTDPPAQGRGIGSALLRPVLERCDSDAELAFVKTATRATVEFYERHGFVVDGEFRLPADGPTLWCLVRQPRAPAAAAADG